MVSCMNYEKCYNQIIEKRRLESPIGFAENHHIVPRSMGGSNDPENLVLLTPREHFVCHHLLAKIYGGPMWSAYFFMSHAKSNSARGISLGPRQYAIAREKYILELKKRTGKNNANFGNTYSQSAKDKISKTRAKYVLENHPRAFTGKLKWLHSAGEIFIGNHFELAKKAGLDIGALRRVSKGTSLSHKGWSCPSVKRVNMRSGLNTNTADKKKYTWVSPKGEEFYGTRFFARENLGLEGHGTSNLVRGTIKKHKGWSIKGV